MAARKPSTVKAEGVDRLPSGRYRARYRDADGRQHTGTFPTVAEAKAWRAQQLDAVARRVDVAPNSRTTVAQYARQYVGTLNYRPATARTAETRLRALERSPLGGMRLVDVRTSHVRAWLTELERTYAPTTAAKYLGWLRSVLTAAVDDRLLGTNPATARVKPKPRTRGEVVPLTVAQVQALADAVPATYRPVVLLGAGTGLRLGELLGLAVEDVDFLRGEVHVRRQLARVSHELAPLKTDGSARTVPLPSMVRDVLAEHLADRGPGPDGLLFATVTGRSVRHDEAQRQIAAGVVAAGLPEGTSALDLRHHFASVLLAAGVDVFKVGAALGHTTPRLVISTYGHLIPDQGAQVRAAVDAAWSVTPVSRRAAGGAAHLR